MAWDTSKKYTLNRDRVNPMELQRNKRCVECNVMKPNTFDHFPKKIWRSKAEFTTVDVCKVCKNQKTRESMKASWSERRAQTVGAMEENIRVRRELLKRNEAIIEKAKLDAAPDLDAAVRNQEGIKPINPLGLTPPSPTDVSVRPQHEIIRKADDDLLKDLLG